MNSNIFVTGYYGTGSSALIDLLSDCKDINVSIGTRYEHSIFLCHDGLFDLEQRLFGANSNQMIRDVALNEFIKETNKQFKYDFGWYGSYNRLFGERFKQINDEFLNSISEIGGQDLFSHTTKTRFSIIKAILQIGAAILTGYKIHKLGRVYVHNSDRTLYLTASYEEFLKAARTYTHKYLELCSVDGKTNVFDHIMLPEQCGCMKFFDNSKLIIVDRDPRDIYFSANYIWNSIKHGSQVAPFPNGIENFCKNWKMMHENTKAHMPDKDVFVLRFEDLIYNYDFTIKQLSIFCDIDINKDSIHTFNPNESIKNTQIFLKKESFKKECTYIEENLKEFLYDFPYTTNSSINEAFDR